MELYDLTKLLHYGIGVLALGAFWTAAFARKGSPLHRTVGKVYLLAMSGIVLTAAVITVLATLRRPGVTSVFLAYLLVITGTGCWLAWRAVRDKRDFARYTGPVYRTLAVLNIASGLSVLAVGLKVGSVLFAGFSLIGVLTGIGMIRLRRNGPAHAMWWRQEHINAMLGNGVATHIAFLSIGLPKILPMLAGPRLQLIAWFGPLVVATVLGIWLKRKYTPRQVAELKRDLPDAQRA